MLESSASGLTGPNHPGPFPVRIRNPVHLHALAWRHIHLQGRYLFRERGNGPDLTAYLIAQPPEELTVFRKMGAGTYPLMALSASCPEI